MKTLIRDQQRLNFTVEDLPQPGRAAVETAIRGAGGRVVTVEHPQTTLESLFLHAVHQDHEQNRADRAGAAADEEES